MLFRSPPNFNYFLTGPFPASLSLFLSFQYRCSIEMFNVKVLPMTGFEPRTWCRKRPLYQLSHNHCTEPQLLPSNLIIWCLWVRMWGRDSECQVYTYTIKSQWVGTIIVMVMSVNLILMIKPAEKYFSHGLILSQQYLFSVYWGTFFI